MLYKRRHEPICVLAISTQVLNRPGVIVTDQNAASGYVSFRPGAAGLIHVDQALTFAEDWTDADRIQYYRNKAAKCAEVLVPDQVEPKYVKHAYVGDEQMRSLFDQEQTSLTATIDGHLFFR